MIFDHAACSKKKKRSSVWPLLNSDIERASLMFACWTLYWISSRSPHFVCLFLFPFLCFLFFFYFTDNFLINISGISHSFRQQSFHFFIRLSFGAHQTIFISSNARKTSTYILYNEANKEWIFKINTRIYFVQI